MGVVLPGARSARLGELFNAEPNKFQLRTAPELLELFERVPNLEKDFQSQFQQ
jgi:hypothetical protein